MSDSSTPKPRRAVAHQWPEIELPQKVSESVYIVQGGSVYKIGKTVDIRQRLMTLQNMSPIRLRLIALLPTTLYDDVEYVLHWMFSQKRSHGEWFALQRKDVQFLCTLMMCFKSDKLDNLGSFMAPQYRWRRAPPKTFTELQPALIYGVRYYKAKANRGTIQKRGKR